MTSKNLFLKEMETEMNRIYSDQIEKSTLLVAGLKKHREQLQLQGFDTSVIESLESDIALMTREGQLIAEEEAALAKHRKECHVILNRLRNTLLASKAEIKKKFDQDQWVNYGVPDKR